MVAIYPPMYSLTPIFNISENMIIEIIEKGYSESFYNKCKDLYSKYKNSIGIDEDNLTFYKLLKSRINYLNKNEDKEIDFDTELNKVISFLETIITKKENYFIEHIEEGRRLKKIKSPNYQTFKIQSISYTPFGTFKSRENKSFTKTSGLLYFDIDIDLNLPDKKKVINFFLKDPYVRASWLSFSAKGFGFFVKAKWETEIEMKKVYYKALEYFHLELPKYNLNNRLFDTQVCSLSRMNILSYGLISKNEDSLTFTDNNYSDSLFSLLHNNYKKDSIKTIPTRPFTELDAKKYEDLSKPDITNKTIVNEDEYVKFLDIITKKLSFNGSSDYNYTIKNYVSRVFKFIIYEDLLENYLFSKIPRTDGAISNYKRLWKCFSNYPEFRTIEPYFYK